MLWQSPAMHVHPLNLWCFHHAEDVCTSLHTTRSPCPPCRCYPLTPPPSSILPPFMYTSKLTVLMPCWYMHEEFIQKGARQMEWKQLHFACKLKAWRVRQGAKVQHGPSQSLPVIGAQVSRKTTHARHIQYAYVEATEICMMRSWMSGVGDGT